MDKCIYCGSMNTIKKEIYFDYDTEISRCMITCLDCDNSSDQTKENLGIKTEKGPA